MTADVSAITESDTISTGSLQALFATPVARMPHPAAETFNHLIADAVLSRIQAAGDLFDYKRETLSNMSRWGDPVIDKLTKWVLAAARRMVEQVLPDELERAGRDRTLCIVVGNSWASAYRAGDQHPAHNHPNTAVTAIYYVQAPAFCELDLLDPRPYIDYYDPGLTFGGADKNVRLTCTPGELVMFPGWLRHAVPKFEGDGERISLSWNLDFAMRAKG